VNVDPTVALVVQDSISSKGVKWRRRAGATKPTKAAKIGSDNAPFVNLAGEGSSPVGKVMDHLRSLRA
jgi:hypothetical protein